MYQLIHNQLHNELTSYGWISASASTSTSTGTGTNKYIYKKTNPYDEFILDYTSSIVNITVPIPFRSDSISYKHTFPILTNKPILSNKPIPSSTETILDYLKIHLANYSAK